MTAWESGTSGATGLARMLVLSLFNFLSSWPVSRPGGSTGLRFQGSNKNRMELLKQIETSSEISKSVLLFMFHRLSSVLILWRSEFYRPDP